MVKGNWRKRVVEAAQVSGKAIWLERYLTPKQAAFEATVKYEREAASPASLLVLHSCLFDVRWQ